MTPPQAMQVDLDVAAAALSRLLEWYWGLPDPTLDYLPVGFVPGRPRPEVLVPAVTSGTEPVRRRR
jgi:hypothetical protein